MSSSSNSGNYNKGAMFVLIAAVLWGTTGTSQALAPSGADPFAIGAVRLFIGGLAQLLIAWFSGSLTNVKNLPLKPILLGGLAMASYQVLFFSGVAKTGVAIGTMVTIGSAPVLAGVLGFVFRGERPGILWGVATLVSIYGCWLLVGSGHADGINIIGFLAALGAGASYALLTLVTKDLTDNYPPITSMAVLMSAGACFLLPVIIFSDLSWLAQPRGVMVALHLGIFATAISYMFFAKGVAEVEVATAATLTLAEPLTAATLGIIVLGEKITPESGVGILLLLGGMLIITIGNRVKNYIEASG